MRARFGTFALAAFAAALSITPTASAAVTGYVVNSDGQPIAGAKVSLLAPETIDARRARLVSATPERAALATAESGSTGKFSLEAPKDAPAVVALRVVARGFSPTIQQLERDDDAGAIALSAAADKRGTITAAGKPVAKATVIWSAGNDEVIATTDDQGHYTVPDPQRWANHLTILHPDFAPVDASFTPFEGGRPQVDRALLPGTALSGRVVAEDGKTAAGKADVFVGELRLATTADDGTFTIAHAPATWETITARTPTLLGSRARSAGTPVTIRLTRGAIVSGTARNAKTQAAIAGAEVRLMRPVVMGRAEILGSAFTDAKGNYTLPAAMAGTLSAALLRPGFSAAPVNFSATAGQKVTKNLAAVEDGRVAGSVVDEEKRPVAGAIVAPTEIESERGPMAMFLRGPRQSRDAISAPDGHFVVRTPPDADLQLNATKKGMPSAKSATLRVAPGERKSNVLLTIPHGVALTGRVIDGDGKPLSGVAVDAAQSTGNPFGMIVRRLGAESGRERDNVVRTGSDGTFSMRVREGSYDVTFQREGFAPKQLHSQQINGTSKPVEVTLEPGAEITGRVTRAGVGVEGVNVLAMLDGSQNGAVTGPDGTFHLSDLTPGPVMLNFRKQDAFLQAMRNVTAPARDVNIDLPAGGRITGRVYDKASKNPVTSFQAGINSSRSGGGRAFMMPPQLRPFSSDDGTFVLENVPPGDTQVVVNAAGYTSGRVAGLNVEDGKTISGIEVALDTGSRLTGRVTGPDGQPVSGAVVRQSGEGPMMRMPDGMATTDANGEFAIEALEPGEKTFQISASGYLTESRTLTLSGREARLDVQLSSGAKVVGVVVNEAGAPVGDATVVVRGGSGHATRSDANGMFQLDGLAPGHYTFSAERSPYAEGIVRDFDIASGAPLRIVMTTGATIYGHVFGLTPAELSHAAVNAYGSSPSEGAEATVDASGNYRMEGAPTGTVHVEAETMNGFGGAARNTAQKSVQVGPGASVQVDLEFKNDTTVRGHVTRNGQTLANAMVDFLPRGDQGSRVRAQADASGNYTATGLEDGSYRVTVVDLDHFTPYSTAFDVKGSATFDIDIKASPLRGRVTDSATGQGVADARVELRPTGNSTDFIAVRGGVTDANGGFLIDAVAPGHYQITASKSGYGSEIHDITVGETQGDALELALAANDGITLKVVDARDGRALTPLVRAYDAQGRVAYEALNRFFGSEGATAQKLAVAPGTYRVVIQMQGYATQSVTLSSPSQPTIGLTPGGTIVLRSSSNTQRTVRLLSDNGVPYERSLFGNAPIVLAPSPGVATVYNIAPGTYTLQVLDETGKILGSGTKVTVVEGGTAEAAL